MSIGLTELIVILIVAACFLGPERAAAAARTLGKGMKAMKEAYKGVAEEVSPIRNELQDLKKEVAENIQPIKEEIKRDIDFKTPDDDTGNNT
ncbi:MAG: twin-arginine translocase TatA/TatE family subunit [Lachnospiraceae bacterium]|nr:twin-arginine translocase TatA/TatE family subunit [Lachnospiraceae bacterium]